MNKNPFHTMSLAGAAASMLIGMDFAKAEEAFVYNHYYPPQSMTKKKAKAIAKHRAEKARKKYLRSCK